MGPETSATRGLLMDGAEAVMLEKGYAALTSRSVAERVGLAHQLVYYYFHTMDDVYVEAFRRLAKRELERLQLALKSEQPVHEVWGICIHTPDSRLISEFMALANRSEGVRREVIRYIEHSRAIQVEALTRATGGRAGGIAGLPPVAVTLMATSIALAITREAQLGVTLGHPELEQLIAASLEALEPRQAAK